MAVSRAKKTAWVYRAALFLVVLLAFALRLCRLDFQDIWWDEARNIDVAGRALAQIAGAPELDIHPPVYFYLLHGWISLTRVRNMPLLGHSAFAMRFISLWFGVLLVALMAALGRRIGGWWVGLGAALAAAFLPFLLGEAQEARMYTVALAWLACAALALTAALWLPARGSIRVRILVMQAIYEEPRSRIGPWLLFALFSALALLTHYAAIFALVVLWGWALAWALIGSSQERRHRLRAVLLSELLTAVFCLPGLPVALRQIPSYRNPNLVVPTVGSYLAELARVYGLGEHLDPSAAQPWAWVLAGWLVVGWLLCFIDHRPLTIDHRLSTTDHRPPTIDHRPSSIVYRLSSIVHRPSIAAAWAILPLVIYYLVIRDRSTFASRYICFALPGWLLLAGFALRGWAGLHPLAGLRRGKPGGKPQPAPGFVSGALAASALVAVLAPGLRGDLFDVRFFREDTRGLVAWLKSQAPPDDLILVDQRYPFGFYYERWNNAADGFPPLHPGNLAPAQYLFVDINTVADRLTELARGHRRVYWVRWFESDTDPRGAVPFLLEKFGTLLGERGFRGYDVSWYEIAPDTQFELAPSLIEAQTEFGDQVRLIGSAFGGRGPGATSTIEETRLPQAPADRAIWATLRWARLPAATKPLKATLILEGPDGAVVGRDDRPIVNDRHLAPPQWAGSDRPLGVLLVHPDPTTPPGTYSLKLAVYDPATLAQLPVSGQAAKGNFVTLGQVELTRATVPPALDKLALDAPITFTWRGLTLLGRGPLLQQISPGDRLAVDLFWRADQGGLPNIRAEFTLSKLDEPVSGSSSLFWESPIAGGYATSGWAAGEIVRDRQRSQLDPTLPAGSYVLELRLTSLPERSLSPAVALGQINVAGRPHVFEPPASLATLSGARFGDFARLLGFDATPPPSVTADGRTKLVLSPASTLNVTLYWQAEKASAIPYAASVQLLDAGGVLRAQHDQPPGGEAAPTTGWIPGEVLVDPYRLDLPTDLAPGRYTLVVRLYDPAALAVLPVTAMNGEPAGDTLTLATVEIR